MYLKLSAVLLLLASAHAYAWDCSIPANRHLNVAGNECYVPVQPKTHPIAPPTTVLLQPSQTQGQGQTQSQTSQGGAGGSAAQHQGQTDVSNSSSKSGAYSNSAGGTATASGGQGGASNSGGNSYTSDESIPHQTPPAFAGSVQPTASCKNARNGGASAPVAGVSFGWSTSDDECDLRETAREFFEMGQPAIGVALLCQSKAAKRLPSCTYAGPVVQLSVAPVAPAIAPPVDAVTHDELRQVERRILQRTTSK